MLVAADETEVTVTTTIYQYSLNGSLLNRPIVGTFQQLWQDHIAVAGHLYKRALLAGSVSARAASTVKLLGAVPHT